MAVKKTIKGDLTSHWWIVALFIIAAVVLAWYIYTKFQADSGGNNNNVIPNTTPYVPSTIPSNAYVPPIPVVTPAGFTVSSGALPVTLNDAQAVMLDPNATPAQVTEAQNIEAQNNNEVLTKEEGITNAPYGFQ